MVRQEIEGRSRPEVNRARMVPAIARIRSVYEAPLRGQEGIAFDQSAVADWKCPSRSRAADTEGKEQHGNRADHSGAAQPPMSPGGNSHDGAQGGSHFGGADHVTGAKQPETQSDGALTSGHQQRDCDEIDDRERSRDDCQECSRAVLDRCRHPTCRELSAFCG